MDEIKQRRADVAWLEQKYSLDIKNCGGVSKSMLKQSRLNFDKIEKCE
jgi:hypothetical protein